MAHQKYFRKKTRFGLLSDMLQVCEDWTQLRTSNFRMVLRPLA